MLFRIRLTFRAKHHAGNHMRRSIRDIQGILDRPMSESRPPLLTAELCSVTAALLVQHPCHTGFIPENIE
jgi:hypothetical protein